MTDCGNVTEIFNDSFISPYTSPEKPADLLLEPDAKFVLVQDDTSTCHGSQAVGMFGDSSQHSEPLLAENGFHDHEGAHVQNDDLPTANVYAAKPSTAINNEDSCNGHLLSANHSKTVPDNTVQSNASGEPGNSLFIHSKISEFFPDTDPQVGSAALEEIPRDVNLAVIPDSKHSTSESTGSAQNSNGLLEDLLSGGTEYNELTDSEMLTVSQKMEAEFREMILTEKKKKQNGTSHGSSKAPAKETVFRARDLQADKSPREPIKRNTGTPDRRPKSASSKLVSKASELSVKGVQAKVSGQSASASPSTPKRPLSRPFSAKTAADNRSRDVAPRKTKSAETHPSRKTPDSPALRNAALSAARSRDNRVTPKKLNVGPPRPTSAPAKPQMTSAVSPRTRPVITSPGTLPDVRTVQSKIGSLDNMKHSPGGGKIKVMGRKLEFSKVSSKYGFKIKSGKRKSDFSHVSSKCGSMDNLTYTPGGGKVRIESRRLDFSHVQSKYDTKGNLNYSPGGGKVKVESKKLDFSRVESKCGSNDNIKHVPQGGKVKIESKKLDFSHVTSKCGSKDNIHYSPSGGKVKIEQHKLDFSHVSSKCGSKDNLTHTPGGGKVKIANKKLDLRSVPAKCGSKDNIHHSPSGGKVKIEQHKLNFSHVSSKCGSKDNLTYSPGGGKVKIARHKVDFSYVGSKCGSKVNLSHTPGGGKVKIESKKLDFSKVESKCGSTDNMKYVPQGGKVKIFHARTDYTAVSSKIGSRQNLHHSPGGGKVKIFNEKPKFDQVQAKVGSKDNLSHTPKGGNTVHQLMDYSEIQPTESCRPVKIASKRIDLSQVTSKCGSLDNAKHKPGGGDVQIFHEKPHFKESAQAKVGSLDNAHYTPTGSERSDSVNGELDQSADDYALRVSMSTVSQP